MKWLDRWLQQWRITKIRRYLDGGLRVLDVGCSQGELLRFIDVQSYVGIDPVAPLVSADRRIQFIQGRFPADLPTHIEAFDAIVMLAVLEHIPHHEHGQVARACMRWLVPHGVVLLTVPSSKVDIIVRTLRRLGAADGMDIDSHYGFDPWQVRSRFVATDFSLVHHRRFQLGLNNLFVFRKHHRLP